jgi:hypothetical protein
MFPRILSVIRETNPERAVIVGPFAYWEFGAGFGAYDRDSGKWRESLKNALLASDR